MPHTVLDILGRMRLFADRREAGEELGEKLQEYRGQAVVLALPRGGVETGVEVARLLGAPLGLVVARKIGHPMSPEYAVCAVTEDGPLICDEAERTALDPLWLRQAEAAGRAEAVRRLAVYQDGRVPIMIDDKVVIVVDDGIATGLTMRAAAAQLRRKRPESGRPRKTVVAVPCAPRSAIDELLELVDNIVVLRNPEGYLGAVGSYYQSFPQLTDEDVLSLLDEAESLG